MKILIPIAGRGTRLRPMSCSRPKVLIEVAGKPMISHIIERLLPLKPRAFVIVRDPNQVEVERFLRTHFKVSFQFAIQPEPKGLGDAVKVGLMKVREPLLVLLGDTIFKAPLRRIIQYKQVAIGLKEVDNPVRFGTVKIHKRKIVRLVEKADPPLSRLAIVGIYWFPKPRQLDTALQSILKKRRQTKGEVQLTDALDEMVSQGAVLHPFKVAGWYDCGTRTALLAAQPHLMRHCVRGRVETSVLVPPVWLSKGSVIEESIVGPNVSIAEKCTIKRSRVRNSVIHASTTVQEATLDQTILGAHVTVTQAKGSLFLGDYAWLGPA